jgi:hypothetical protein
MTVAYLQNTLSGLLGLPPRITQSHLSAVAPLLTPAATIAMIESILADQTLLDLVAGRSYTHSLGFRKITLLDPGFVLPDQNGKRGNGYTVRLHIWESTSNDTEAAATVPLVEAKHEHSFDFISRILYGGMETQCYTSEPLSAVETADLKYLLARLETLEESQRRHVSRSMEALETMRLKAFGSAQADSEAINCALNDCDRNALQQLLAVDADQLERMANLQGRYQYDLTASTFGGDYVHKLVHHVSLKPVLVKKLEAGDLYFHGHRLAHRLYMPANQPNATLVITTQVSQEAIGASFQHPTWFSGEHVGYPRRMYSSAEMRAILTEFKQRLLALSAAALREKPTNLIDLERTLLT